MARKYRKRKRAADEEETRRRIAQALVDLHGSVGPARTTVQAVAERAGVQRATVYRHFPDEPSMFAACSAHWAQQNPFPDPHAWTEETELEARLRRALDELYGFYSDNETMLDNTTRDEPRVPALRPAMEGFRSYLRAASDAVLAEAAAEKPTLRAAVGHALSFSTWRSLVREQGLPRAEAAELMGHMVKAAAHAGSDTVGKD